MRVGGGATPGTSLPEGTHHRRRPAYATDGYPARARPPAPGHERIPRATSRDPDGRARQRHDGAAAPRRRAAADQRAGTAAGGGRPGRASPLAALPPAPHPDAPARATRPADPAADP